MTKPTDEYWMKQALAEAQLAFAEDVIPVGCVVVADDQIIGRGRRRADGHASLDHAEMIALRNAIQLPRRNGRGLTLYTTLEPCAMCFGTIAHNYIDRVVYALDDPEGGATKIDLQGIRRYERGLPVIGKDVLRSEVKALMKKFFQTTKHPYWAAHPDSVLVKFCLE